MPVGSAVRDGPHSTCAQKLMKHLPSLTIRSMRGVSKSVAPNIPRSP